MDSILPFAPRHNCWLFDVNLARIELPMMPLIVQFACLFSCTARLDVRMRFRKLRIAISAVSLVACLVLIVMWVRSYYAVFRVRATGQRIEIVSWKGVVTVNPRVIMTGRTFGRTALARIPYLPPVLMLITLGGLPWVQWYWGFSLRAMLIAMTLVAIGLGVIASSR